MRNSDHLFSREFISLNGVLFLSFSNLAIFFQFYQYLQTLPISPEWFGLMIGLFNLTALILRPLISPFLHPGNAPRVMGLSCLGIIAALIAYNFSSSFWPMVFVRILHGAGYVCLVSAMMAMVVAFIPSQRSGLAFSVISVTILLPYATIPLVLSAFSHKISGFQQVLNYTAVLMLLVFPLLAMIKTSAVGSHGDGRPFEPINRHDFVQNLRNRNVLKILLVSLVYYCGYASVFFFLEGFAKGIGIRTPGLFFTIAFVTMIFIRLSSGSLFDKVNKRHLIKYSFTAVTIGYLLLPLASGPLHFYALAVFFGLGWGVTMPLFNALMFDISSTRFQGLNVNLATEMIDGGFFLGPFIGGLMLSSWNHAVVFVSWGIVGLLVLALLSLIRERNPS